MYFFLQILVLLDVLPDQEMQDEGLAREIINRVQKLRKKAHLVPTDQINVYYSISPQNGDLDRVAKKHTDLVETAIRAPFIRSKPVGGIIANEEQEVGRVRLLTCDAEMRNVINNYFCVQVEKCKTYNHTHSKR